MQLMESLVPMEQSQKLVRTVHPIGYNYLQQLQMERYQDPSQLQERVNS